MIGKNNPLNVRYSPLNDWIGLVSNNKSTRGFCNFRDRKYCYRAVGKLIFGSYRTLYGIKTYAEIIRRYAPPSENDTENYIAFVCDRCGVFPWDEPKTLNEKTDLIYAMLQMECRKDEYNAFDWQIIYDSLKKYML